MKKVMMSKETEQELLRIEREKLELEKRKEKQRYAAFLLAVAAENSRRAHYRRQNQSWVDRMFDW